GFLGTGGRCQQHIDVIVDLRDDGQAVEPFAVCDVWDGDETLGKRTNDKKNRTGRGLYPSAKTCGIPMDAGKGRISKDYRNFRNSSVGQWRYYPLKKDMTPAKIDWDMWLGHKFKSVDDGSPLGPKPEEMPFDRAVWAQWRCYWPFGGGMFTDLFVHQTTHLIAAMGVRYPGRVVGAGGIYLEYDNRDVPDVATVVADYGEGCQVIISATMCNDTQLGEII